MRYISFEEIRQLSDKLCEQIRNRDLDKFDCVIGIAKGGVIPATLVAYNLEVETFKTIQIKSYTEDNTRSNTTFSSGTLSLFDELSKYNNILLVDDLADSGKTLQAFEDIYKYLRNITKVPKITTACLYCKKNSEFRPDHYSELVTSDDWLIFPWEVNTVPLHHK
jgi:xanthine phosphoribosyltransferase